MPENYQFAVFIFALAAATIFLARFAFGGVKRRLRELNEREAALLKLYRDIESISNTFHSEAEVLLDSLREAEERVWTPAPGQPPAAPPHLLSASAKETAAADEEPQKTRREEVLRLFAEGLSADEIAQELSVTHNEVSLIISVAGKRSGKPK
ncbi:MAG: hypothetical protein LBK23_12045 [Oscillospiraceae bacterium]|jgi:ATP/maltotriose-dependent transcriptional regulator MalT|nr:hypothetical protein [Oscillospiraceae bacterium]